MLRITPEQVPLLMSYHERYTENLTRHAVADIPFHNTNCDVLLLNYSDYVLGCLYSDCHSRYDSAYTPEVFLQSSQSLERLSVRGTIDAEDKQVLKTTLCLFQVECCMLAIWLDSLITADNVDKIRVIPTVPLVLKPHLVERTPSTYVEPNAPELMEVIGWLGVTYGSLMLTDTQAVYRAVTEQACKADGYALFLYNLLQHLYATFKTSDALAFTCYNLEEL